MTNEELWRAVLGEIELSISKANFITWFKNTAIISNSSGKVIIGVPNGFAKEWLENKYNAYIYKAIRSFQGDVKEVTCIIQNIGNFHEMKNKEIDAVRAPQVNFKKAGVSSVKDLPMERCLEEANLNPRYVFEKFIVGENNELARAACYAVSQNPGNVYNPLFIYGGVGLGKTHLLQAIGNEIIKNSPEKKIRYATSEKFTTELIDSIKSQKIAFFKEKYQKMDLLIIDDVQFLSGKEKTQQEFFHIFNALYQLNKQIVISSDRPPKAIPTLEERLRSRFEGGMIADIGKPDLETRMAILRSKLAEKGFLLDDDSVKFIAENIKSNIRELEGALSRVIASCEIENINPDIKYIERVLSELISSGKRKGVNYKHLIKVVSEYYDISDIVLISKGRKRDVVLPRQIAMYLLRSELQASYPGIGELFGGRDHTTALHAYEKISRELNENEKLQEDINIIKEKMYSI